MQLRRVISGNKNWVPQIDGLRFLAIMGVLLAHILGQILNGHGGYGGHFYQSAPNSGAWAYFVGEMGRTVSLFFVLSGYILGLPFVRSHIEGGKPVPLGGFYLRRITRLEPPYVLSLLIYGGVRLIGIDRGQLRHVGSSLIVMMLYVRNFFGNIPTLNPPTWSLEVEIQFYLLAPLLAMVFLIRRSPIRYSVIGLGILISSLPPWRHANSIGFFLPSELCYFLTGFLLADLKPHERLRMPLWAWDSLAAVGLLIFMLMPPNWSHTFPCLALLVFFPAALAGRISKHVLGLPWVAITGGMCYSLYLTHMLVLMGLWRLSRNFLTHRNLGLDYAVQVAVILPAVFGVGFLYYIMIERPCMDPAWPRKAVNAIRFVFAFRAPQTASSDLPARDYKA